MKIKGLGIVAFGIIMLLVNKGMISAETWSMVWPVLVIIAGILVSFKHHMWHGGMCGAECAKGNMCECGGAAGCCGKGEGDAHTCSGEGCSTCGK